MPTVLVTGAGRGIGLEFARQYAADGWQVLACVRSPQHATALQELARAAPAAVEVLALDVGEHASIDALAAQLGARPIDVLINNAGTMGKANFAKQGFTADRFGSSDFSDWASVFRINAFAPMKMAEAFVAHVARSEQKKIVSLTSVLGSIGRNALGGLYLISREQGRVE